LLGSSRLYAEGEVNLHTAVDKLQADAVSTGLVELIGQDKVQSLMADAFGPTIERERVLLPKANLRSGRLRHKSAGNGG
jgi:hypothetical protein